MASSSYIPHTPLFGNDSLAISILNKGSVASLSHPSSSHNPPSARDIPPVALTDITIVQADEFNSYISRVVSIYQDLQRLRDDEGQERSRSGLVEAQLHQDPLGSGKGPELNLKASAMSVESFPPQNNPQGRENIGPSRKTSIELPSLSAIPTVYSDDNFRLENPRVFDIVSERADIIPPSASTAADGGDALTPRKALATNAILQEKLSWYMDTVEVHLVDSISQASTGFFSALNSLQELHSELAESVDTIQALRQDLVSLDHEVVTEGRGLLDRQQQHRNLQKLGDGLRQLQSVVDGVSHCESLIDDGEVEQALDEIDVVELALAGRSAPGWYRGISANINVGDMRGVIALQGIDNDLTMLRSTIGKVYESKLHSLLIGDLRGHVESVSTQETLKRWESTSLRARRNHGRDPPTLPACMSVADELRSVLASNISGLYRSKSISVAIKSYRALVLREIQDIVRRPLPSSSEDNDSIMSGSSRGGGRSLDKQQKSSILARNIRNLDAQDAETMLIAMYLGVAETLRRLKTQLSLLLETASVIGDPDAQTEHKPSFVSSPINSPKPSGNTPVFEIQGEIYASLDLSRLLGQMVELSHEKIIKVLRVRSQQVAALPLTQFLRYFTLNLLFANECEAISGHTATSLRAVINKQINDFIVSHRDWEVQTLAQGMSDDNWQDTDFAARDNEILEQILQCSISEPPAWTKAVKIWLPIPQGGAKEVENLEISKHKTTRCVATIEQETFLLPYSAMLCLRGISRFLRLINRIPSVAPDIVTSLISYLQTFDSRCRQLVLGAGAMRSAGLKNITPKNLVLASQALSFIKTLIEYISKFIQRVAPGTPNTNFISEFDKVRHGLQEHQDSIYQKIVEIMESRALTLSLKVRDTQWDKERPENVRKYISDLTTDTTRVYKALYKYLPEHLVKNLMVSIFTTYKTYLGNAFKEIDPLTDIGRDCILRDVEYLTSKLDKVKGFGDLGTYLAGIFNGKVDTTISPGPPPRQKD